MKLPFKIKQVPSSLLLGSIFSCIGIRNIYTLDWCIKLDNRLQVSEFLNFLMTCVHHLRGKNVMILTLILMQGRIFLKMEMCKDCCYTLVLMMCCRRFGNLQLFILSCFHKTSNLWVLIIDYITHLFISMK